MSMTMKKPVTAFIGTILLAMTAHAHHSGAMFDSKTSKTVEGIVKEWQWINPHAWLQVLTPDGKGGSIEQGFELGSPSTLVRNGYKYNTFKPGDKVKVVYHPRLDGTVGGELSWVKSETSPWLKWIASSPTPPAD